MSPAMSRQIRANAYALMRMDGPAPFGGNTFTTVEPVIHDLDPARLRIPGTYVFDGKHAHGAYPLNKLLFSLNDAGNRDQFARDPAAYCDAYGVSGKYKELVLEKDFLGMLRAGANIYYLGKDGRPAWHVGTGCRCPVSRYLHAGIQAKLLAKGDDLAQRLASRGGFWNG